MTNALFQMRLGKKYNLTPQLSKFLLLLVTLEYVSENVVQERIGHVPPATLAHRLRIALRRANFDVKIKCMRGYGYWIDDDAKRRFVAIPELRISIIDAVNEEAFGKHGYPHDETDAPVGERGVRTGDPCYGEQKPVHRKCG